MSRRTTYNRNQGPEQHYAVLAHLQSGGEPTVKAISAALHIHQATVYVALKRLVMEGMIVTGVILHDFVITLTDEGAEYKVPEAAQSEDLLPCGHSKVAAGRLGFCLPCRQEQRRVYCKNTQYLPLLRVQMRRP
jgi:hypothetical protein